MRSGHETKSSVRQVKASLKPWQEYRLEEHAQKAPLSLLLLAGTLVLLVFAEGLAVVAFQGLLEPLRSVNKVLIRDNSADLNIR